MGLKSGLGGTNSKPHVYPDLVIPLTHLMCVWDHCPVGTRNCTPDPIFCWWFYVFLKNLVIILLLNYSIYCLWSSRSTGSKTATQHYINMGLERSSATTNPNHSEEVKRPRYKLNLIHTISYYHQNWLFKLLNVHFWSSRFGHIFRRPIMNWDSQPASWSNMCSSHSITE